MCQQAAERAHQLWGKLNFKSPKGSFPGNRLRQSWLLYFKKVVVFIAHGNGFGAIYFHFLKSVREWRNQTVVFPWDSEPKLLSLSTGFWSQLHWLRHYIKNLIYSGKPCWSWFWFYIEHWNTFTPQNSCRNHSVQYGWSLLLWSHTRLCAYVARRRCNCSKTLRSVWSKYIKVKSAMLQSLKHVESFWRLTWITCAWFYSRNSGNLPNKWASSWPGRK